MAGKDDLVLEYARFGKYAIFRGGELVEEFGSFDEAIEEYEHMTEPANLPDETPSTALDRLSEEIEKARKAFRSFGQSAGDS